MSLPDDPIQRAVLSHAITFETIATADVVAIIGGDDPKPADKRAAAQTLKRLVADGWLDGSRGRYAPTQRTLDQREPVTVGSVSKRDDPLRSVGSVGPSPVDRVNAIVARAEALGLDVLDPEIAEQVRLARAVHASQDWRISIPALFPRAFSSEFADHHAMFWEWVWSIAKSVAPPPWISVWPREGGKSTNVEAALIALGARGIREYAWVVCANQEAADTHVDSIEAMLTSSEVAAVYPGMSTRDKGKYGPKEWRKNRLVTEAGFVVDAIGLDVAARGRRFEERRPDVMAIDDLDDSHDSPRATDKRIATLTRKILPSGTTDCAVMAVQNLVHSRSIFARLANQPGVQPADFLANRIVSGPIKLVNHLDTERADNGNGYVIRAGEATWPAKGIPGAQAVLDRLGLTAFLIECQHEEGSLGGGIFEHLTDEFQYGGSIYATEADLPELKATVCTVDPAVTSTDQSDSCGIVVTAIGANRHYYVLWSWERVTTPLDALKLAINQAMAFGARVVRIEDNQGKDLWQYTWKQALTELLDNPDTEVARAVANGGIVPRREAVSAPSNASKAERASVMLADYELGRVHHVHGDDYNCAPLEAGLRRFPLHKPYDVVDGAYWAYDYLRQHGGEQSAGFRMGNPSKRGASIGPIAR